MNTNDSATAPDLYEMTIGVYATPEAVRDTVTRFGELLDAEARAGRAVRWDVGVVDATGYADPDGDLPLTDYHDDLPEQWRLENPGQDPGKRAVHEIRVGLFVTEERGHEIGERLTHVLCPDHLHSGACPIPWSAGYTVPVDDRHRDYLEHRYAHVRPSGQ
ncbi:hypothetical protein [Marinactinospora rubrisoli]|uniref:Uncharacterized protein n=1 Tax=Marinactinospora rubrisoli TaxID=2715399 RepID=A0ABW2KI14_9ACTN